MKFDRFILIAAFAKAQDDKEEADKVDIQDPSPPRNVVPVREYMVQQLLHALQGRGVDDVVLGLEQTLAGAVANTQNLLWKNEIVEGLARQRELIRRGVDSIDDNDVPSFLAEIPKRTKGNWNGKIAEPSGERLPSFADVMTDNWSQTVKETVNLPIMGPFNPALWKPEDVSEVIGPVVNMIPHETAKLVKHKEETEGLSVDWSGLIDTDESVVGQSLILNDNGGKLPRYESEIPGFGHVQMDDEWHAYKLAPQILDVPLMGPLNPMPQLSANLPAIYLPYKALRLKEHAPEWMRLEGLNAMMPINAYTPKEPRERVIPLHSLLRGISRRRLSEEKPSWTEQLTQSRIVRSILHYLPRYRGGSASDPAVQAADEEVPNSESNRQLAKNLSAAADALSPASSSSSSDETLAAAAVSRQQFADDVPEAFAASLDSKRYYRAFATDQPGEVRGSDI